MFLSPALADDDVDNEKFVVDRDGTIHYGPLRMSAHDLPYLPNVSGCFMLISLT